MANRKLPHSGKFHYRLSPKQKAEIAQNLIDILCKKSMITEQTRAFVANWILTVRGEKGKVFFDVWDIVLKNYMPTSRPVLFRSCRRRYDGKIASFTRRLECARRFSKGKGFLLVCDTEETLEHEELLYVEGQYKHTFYPLVDLLKIAQESGGWGFSDRLLNNYIGEQEYIMRVDMDDMHSFKWPNSACPSLRGQRENFETPHFLKP